MGSIQLHQTKGVNPKLTFCPRCGGDANELVLVGSRETVSECDGCHIKGYGVSAGTPHRRENKFTECTGTFRFDHRMTEYEKLPATSPCDKCVAELEEHKQIVDAGGVYWKCEGGCGGVIKKSEYADAVRQTMGIEAPAPCGVLMPVDECPNKEAHQ